MSWKSAILAAALSLGAAQAAAAAPHNVIIFVADGLRSRMVTPQTAPALAELRAQGVDLQNSHSVYPTVTTVNAAAIATGRLPGDSGDFGNTIHVGAPLPAPYATSIAALEDDTVLGLLNERFGGDYLGHGSLLAAARAKGYATAAIGKQGPVAIQDVTARDGLIGIIVDDGAGSRDEGLPLAPDLAAAIKAAGLPTTAPDRGLNAWAGAYNMPGVRVANVEQQNWFVAVTTKVLLPRFKAQGKPFALVFWSRDPDGTQHAQGDSLNQLSPGINGPTSLAAIRNASDDLAAIRAAVQDLGLADDTDIVAIADHGFSTVSRQSRTSPSTKVRYRDVVPGFLPPGFVAIDLSRALNLPLSEPGGLPVAVREGNYPKKAGLLGRDPRHPEVVVAPNGGTDLIYLPGADPKATARRIVDFLETQDYVGGIFVRDDLGPLPGALPTSEIGLAGDARTPAPAIVVSFATGSTGCADPETCATLVADTEYQQGQGIHGSLSRQDTHNFMAAAGPDFKAGYLDPAPVGNADVPVTLAHVLGLDLGPGAAAGRVMTEALKDGTPAGQPVRTTLRATPGANGFTTTLSRQDFAGARYLDAAGSPGRALGLQP